MSLVKVISGAADGDWPCATGNATAPTSRHPTANNGIRAISILPASNLTQMRAQEVQPLLQNPAGLGPIQMQFERVRRLGVIDGGNWPVFRNRARNERIKRLVEARGPVPARSHHEQWCVGTKIPGDWIHQDRTLR